MKLETSIYFRYLCNASGSPIVFASHDGKGESSVEPSGCGTNLFNVAGTPSRHRGTET